MQHATSIAPIPLSPNSLKYKLFLGTLCLVVTVAGDGKTDHRLPNHTVVGCLFIVLFSNFGLNTQAFTLKDYHTCPYTGI